MTVHVHIERLVLQGMPSRDGGAALGAAIRAELAQLMAPAAQERRGMHDPVARQVAQAVHAAIGASGAGRQGGRR
jgi:hypothetical protein